MAARIERGNWGQIHDVSFGSTGLTAHRPAHDNVFRSNGETLLIESPALATSTNDVEESY